MRLLPILLLLVPLVELYVMIRVGSEIGALITVVLVVGTAMWGLAMMRAQGFSTMQRMQRAAQRGEVPAVQALEGVAVGLGGMLLLFPGFLTDGLGLLFLIPPTRRWLIRRLLRRMIVTDHRGGPPRGGPGAGGGRVIEGRVEPDERD